MGRELEGRAPGNGPGEDDAVQRYVQQLGMRPRETLAAADTPPELCRCRPPAATPLLPGGYIYITRGILPYLDNEAQPAGALRARDWARHRMRFGAE